MEKLALYIEVNQLRKRGFKIAAISKKLGISRNTVYKYLDMSFDEATDWVSTLKTRSKKLDPYRDIILVWLKEHPDLSSAQIEDWLKEKIPAIEVGSSTLRSYVSELRDSYHIPKVIRIRDHEAVDELPMGMQVQVDWGEMKVKTSLNKEVKLYFISFVLSHSRYKYVEWQDRPFTTRDTIRCHESAFQYFGGMPEEIVYDQDHLITVNENAGDIILTGDFQAYKQERSFRVYLCRKSDPQSKGKIENVVKFIKGNFAKNRVFFNLESWNEKCLAWLDRTGNQNVHNTTKKRPAEVHALEKQHLSPVSSLLSLESDLSNSITRSVHKDNVIKYKSNRYSLPLGTYRPKGNNTVYVEVKESELVIRATPQGDILARHRLGLGKGELIKNRNHGRDRSKGIEAFKETVIRQLSNSEQANQFIQEVGARYPRYMRDQLQVIQHTINQYRPFIDQALTHCVRDHLWSANDLRDVTQHLHRLTENELFPSPSFQEMKMTSTELKGTAQTRDLTTYIEIMGGLK
ncbi:IS21 family transposase (plasmid) [Niallia taxi]|uniref:IS21 family transposase n=2 Tax=Niallia taxi TaxID=2499688 RepID=A0A3S2TR06_9BACI|nr:IS21 family transposase [Niallia taxi]MDK8643939.1 IS21 family transposase [Niallia taxi]MED4057444.1 IS21 family transposase [Niallia taxi]MED4118063.1 IS21 family transposase [Niallia taxi]RVT56567.1 IS21 family transposase [Niallia taxi]